MKVGFATACIILQIEQVPWISGDRQQWQEHRPQSGHRRRCCRWLELVRGNEASRSLRDDYFVHCLRRHTLSCVSWAAFLGEECWKRFHGHWRPHHEYINTKCRLHLQKKCCFISLSLATYYTLRRYRNAIRTALNSDWGAYPVSIPSFGARLSHVWCTNQPAISLICLHIYNNDTEHSLMQAICPNGMRTLTRQRCAIEIAQTITSRQYLSSRPQSTASSCGVQANLEAMLQTAWRVNCQHSAMAACYSA